MEQTLAERLLERFTPEELATVRAALARIEDRAKATLDALPKSSETEKVPTPASDSVKGERDRHGRLIVKREGHAMVVKVEENTHGSQFTVSDLNGDYYFSVDCGGVWAKDTLPLLSHRTEQDAMGKLPLAAATPLPTPSPAAVEAYCPPFLNGTDAAAAIEKLTRRIEALEARQ